MENNDFQKDVNNVNENANQSNNQNVQKKQKNEKRKTVILIVILLILVLVAGIFGGILISGNGDKVTNIINQGEEKKEENKTSKKVDESKPWVYDADYMKENKKIYSDSKKTEEYACNSNKDLVVPYININSDDAKKVNEKIKGLYDEYYEKYGKEKVTPYSSEYKVYYHYDLKYDKYVNDNILSVIITLHEGETVVDGGTGGGIYRTYTYNFNLDTLKEASLDEMAVKCGFSSGDVVINKINEWEKKQKEILAKADDSDIFDGVQTNKYIIDGNGKLNFLYRTNTSAAFDHLQPIENGKEIEFFYAEEQAEKSKESKKNATAQTAKTDFLFMANEGFTNVTYQSEKKDNSYLYKIAFDGNGNPTISVEYHETGYYGNNMYGTYKDFYNVEYDVGAGQAYVSFKFKDLNGTGSEQNGVIHYSHVTDNENITLKLSVPYGSEQNKEITLYKIYTYERPDDTKRTSGTLTVTKRTENSFNFEIDATRITGEDIEKSLEMGGINIGHVSGVAKKIADGKYQFVPDKDDDIMAVYESEYKINFIIKNDNSIQIEEEYDTSKYSQGPYGGANVRFAGVYNK